MDMNDFSASPFNSFNRRKRPRTNWIGGYLGPRTGLKELVKRSVSALAGNPNLVLSPLEVASLAIPQTYF
jgi:hypothetical protein